MPVTGVNMIKHHVSDWDAALDFYRLGLGLRLVHQQTGVWASFEAPGGGRIGLVGEREGVRRAPHILLQVERLPELLEALRAKGAKVVASLWPQPMDRLRWSRTRPAI